MNKDGQNILGTSSSEYKTLMTLIKELREDLTLIEIWKGEVTQVFLDLKADHIIINDKLKTAFELLEELNLNKVDKKEGYDLVKVEDLIGGDGDSVANIQSIRDYIDSLHAVPKITGEFVGSDLKACNVALIPTNILELKLNKGVYLINGHVVYRSNGDSKAKVYIEIDGVVQEKSTVIFGNDKYGVIPITALITIADDDTTVTIRAERVQGTDISIISNDATHSYINYVKVD